jgi:sucrose phosphorylase
MLHALYTGDVRRLRHWLEISPRNSVTVLDTHDRIGVIDVGPDQENPESSPGLLAPQEIDALVERIHNRSSGESRQATGAAASNLDLYQVNGTYYDALGRRDDEYLMARPVQFFAPGIPQIYYVGLLGGTNDVDLLHRTGIGRDVNRHYYTPAEVEAQLDVPVVRSPDGSDPFSEHTSCFRRRFSSHRRWRQLACDGVERWSGLGPSPRRFRSAGGGTLLFGSRR